jgi:hypothetical protein
MRSIAQTLLAVSPDSGYGTEDLLDAFDPSVTRAAGLFHLDSPSSPTLTSTAPVAVKDHPGGDSVPLDYELVEALALVTLKELLDEETDYVASALLKRSASRTYPSLAEVSASALGRFVVSPVLKDVLASWYNHYLLRVVKVQATAASRRARARAYLASEGFDVEDGPTGAPTVSTEGLTASRAGTLLALSCGGQVRLTGRGLDHDGNRQALATEIGVSRLLGHSDELAALAGEATPESLVKVLDEMRHYDADVLDWVLSASSSSTSRARGFAADLSDAEESLGRAQALVASDAAAPGAAHLHVLWAESNGLPAVEVLGSWTAMTRGSRVLMVRTSRTFFRELEALRCASR